MEQQTVKTKPKTLNISLQTHKLLTQIMKRTGIQTYGDMVYSLAVWYSQTLDAIAESEAEQDRLDAARDADDP